MSYVPKEFADEVRNAAAILDVISWYSTFSRKDNASGNVMVPSPWKPDEKTDSCSVHVEKKIFNDHSSGNKGDLFKLVMLKENLSYPDAVLFVGRKYNLSLSPKIAEEHATRINSALDTFLKASIRANAQHQDDIQKLIKPLGIPTKWITSFNIGYTPDEIPQSLRPETATQLGILTADHKCFAPKSLIFPLKDDKMRIVGLVGFDGEKLTKTNSTIFFDRDRHLWKINVKEGDPKAVQATKVFSNPFTALGYLAAHAGAPIASTLGAPLTMEIYARAIGLPDSPRQSFAEALKIARPSQSVAAGAA